MPTFSRNSWVRRSGGVSTNRFPSGSPRTNPQRVRLLRGSVLVHVSQPHPTTGTPIDVPVPKKSNWPRTSVEENGLNTVMWGFAGRIRTLNSGGWAASLIVERRAGGVQRERQADKPERIFWKTRIRIAWEVQPTVIDPSRKSL